MYVCLYVHKLLLHFSTDFLQTGTKIFQIFPAGPVLFRIFYFAPAGGAPTRFSRFFQEILPHTLSYASDQIFFFTENVEEFKADKKYSDTFLPTVDGLGEKIDFSFKILATF